MSNRKVSARVRWLLEVRGLRIVSLCQPQHLFRSGERRHKNVAEPADPWWAGIGNGEIFGPVRYGIGDTPDAAVLAALPADLISALRRCEDAVDSLRDCLQK